MNPFTVTKPFFDVKSDAIELVSGDYSTTLQLTADLGESVIVDAGEGAASVQSSALAQVGSLRVRLSGITSGVNAISNSGGGAVDPSHVEAGWNDSVTISSDQFPPGHLFAVEARIALTGTAQAAVIGGPVGGFRVGRAMTGATLFPQGYVMTAPYPGNRWAYAVDNLNHTETQTLPPPNLEPIPIAVLWTNKQANAHGMILHGTGQAVSSSGIANEGSVLATFDADFANTLQWGGITRVTDAATGEEISDWTVTSESGFDYSKPFEVPEPSAPLLFAAAAAALAVRARAMSSSATRLAAQSSAGGRCPKG